MVQWGNPKALSGLFEARLLFVPHIIDLYKVVMFILMSARLEDLKNAPKSHHGVGNDGKRKTLSLGLTYFKKPEV